LLEDDLMRLVLGGAAASAVVNNSIDLEFIREKIMRLSDVTPEFAWEKLKELGARLKMEDFASSCVGDIVVVKLSDRLLYGRVTRRNECFLVVNVGRGQCVKASHAQVRSVPSEARKLIERGQVSQVVVDHFVRLQESLAGCARMHVLESLKTVFSYPDEWARGSVLLSSLSSASIVDLDLLKKLEADAVHLMGSSLLSDSVIVGKLSDIFATYLENLTAWHFSGKSRETTIARVLGLGQTLHLMVNTELSILTEGLTNKIKLLQQECEDILR
jgi:hypothetical protein